MDKNPEFVHADLICYLPEDYSATDLIQCVERLKTESILKFDGTGACLKIYHCFWKCAVLTLGKVRASFVSQVNTVGSFGRGGCSVTAAYFRESKVHYKTIVISKWNNFHTFSGQGSDTFYCKSSTLGKESRRGLLHDLRQIEFGLRITSSINL